MDVNQCLEKEKTSDILSVLKSNVCNTNDVIPECSDEYYDALSKAKRQKSGSGKSFCRLAQANYRFQYESFCGIVFS